MRVIGIIAEFNPFHEGHEYLIKEAKKLVADPRAVVMTVMSGPFVQRGLPSVAPKHIRAKMALNSGVDVAIELPFTFACAPSERFAKGAVELLYRTGVVTDLAFGVDCQDPSLLLTLAELEPDDDVIKASLQEGKSYPAARADGLVSKWLQENPGADNTDAVREALRMPNSSLALDYIKAVKDLKTGFKIHMIPRIPGHSATSTREKLFSSDTSSISSVANSLIGTIPDKALAVWLSALSCGNTSIPNRDRYIRTLISMTEREDDLTDYAYMTDGLDGYIKNNFENVRGNYSFNSVTAKLATKHFTMPRIQRALASLIVGQKAEYVDTEKHVQYIRVLGFSREGRYCLKVMSKCSRLPIIHNCSDALELYSEKPRLKTQFELDLRANSIQAEYLGMNPNYEWSVPPVVVK